MSSSIAIHTHGVWQAPPLVLLHAFPLDSRMWAPMIGHLDGVAVLTVDAPGFGSSPPREEVGLECYARDLVAALAARGIERAVLAGLSMGGYVALAVAQQAPSLVAGLGLLNTKASADTEPARARRMAMVAALEAGEQDLALGMADGLLGSLTRRTRPEVVAQVRHWLGQAAPAGLIWAQRSMAQRPDRAAVLAALPSVIPALVLHGAQDALMTSQDAEAMAQLLRVPVTEAVGVGHLSAVEDPAQVAAELAQLYRRALRAPTG